MSYPHPPESVTEVKNTPISVSEWPIGKKSAYFSCFIAFALGLFDLIDRQILASLFPFLKAEYGLTDGQLGSLMSVLNIAIAIMVVPSGYFIDRWSRKYMLVLMGVVWSLATLACAFATNYFQLLVARFICGAGEAGYNPAAQSLLSASFPKRLRTTAAGMAQFGMFVGGPVGLLVGAYVATHFGWRQAFGVVAIPGLVISGFALLLKDFKTQPKAKVEDDAKKVEQVSYASVLIQMIKTPSMLCVFLGAATVLFYSALLTTWLPSYFSRVGNMPITTASGISAVVTVAASIGLVLFAPVVDVLRRSRANAAAIWLFGSMLLSVCLSVYIFTIAVPASTPQIVAMFTLKLLIGAVPSVGSGIILDLTAPGERGTAISIQVLSQNIFGMAIGPVLAGFMSDKFGLQLALFYCSFIVVIGVMLYLVCCFTFKRDLAKVHQPDVVFA